MAIDSPSHLLPTVVQSLTVLPNYTWNIHTHGKCMDVKNCLALKDFPDMITSPSLLKRLILHLGDLHVCAGNPDENFLRLADSRKGKFHSTNNKPVAFVDNFFPVSYEGIRHDRTVRSSTCEYLVKLARCESCKKYRSSLRSMYSRWSTRQTSDSSKHTSVSSHTNYRYLNTPERKKRMLNLKNELDDKRKEVESLKRKLKSLTEENGVTIDTELQEDLASIIEENVEEITQKYAPDSFQRLFWEQQSASMKLKDKRQVRWHPMYIKWCLSLKLVSSACYRALRSSNVINLPSERTLRDYTHFVKAKAGFQPDLDKELIRQAKLDEIPEYKKFVCLVFDEMKVKEDLVYNKHSGQLIGFMNIGDVNNQLLELEQTCKQSNAAPKLATHMLTFMVRGLLSELDFPYASFPCLSLGGDQLYSIVWGAVRRLEACGMKVLALTSDGASCNRNFYKLHKSTSDHVMYKAKNPYSADDRSIFFISDPPHLIKTVRNCWANSHAHSGTRNLWVIK